MLTPYANKAIGIPALELLKAFFENAFSKI
jgi:hypothetical protein